MSQWQAEWNEMNEHYAFTIILAAFDGFTDWHRFKFTYSTGNTE